MVLWGFEEGQELLQVGLEDLPGGLGFPFGDDQPGEMAYGEVQVGAVGHMKGETSPLLHDYPVV